MQIFTALALQILPHLEEINAVSSVNDLYSFAQINLPGETVAASVRVESPRWCWELLQRWCLVLLVTSLFLHSSWTLTGSSGYWDILSKFKLQKVFGSPPPHTNYFCSTYNTVQKVSYNFLDIQSTCFLHQCQMSEGGEPLRHSSQMVSFQVSEKRPVWQLHKHVNKNSCHSTCPVNEENTKSVTKEIIFDVLLWNCNSFSLFLNLEANKWSLAYSKQNDHLVFLQASENGEKNCTACALNLKPPFTSFCKNAECWLTLEGKILSCRSSLHSQNWKRSCTARSLCCKKSREPEAFWDNPMCSDRRTVPVFCSFSSRKEPQTFRNQRKNPEQIQNAFRKFAQKGGWVPRTPQLTCSSNGMWGCYCLLPG